MTRRQRVAANSGIASNHKRVPATEWDIAGLDVMPTLEEICLAPLQTKDFIGDALLPQAEQQFNRCVANVLLNSRQDDCDFIGTDQDNVGAKAVADVMVGVVHVL